MLAQVSNGAHAKRCKHDKSELPGAAVRLKQFSILSVSFEVVLKIAA